MPDSSEDVGRRVDDVLGKGHAARHAGPVSETNRYAVPLAKLEAEAHVPVEDQVEEVPEPDSPDPAEGAWTKLARWLPTATGSR